MSIRSKRPKRSTGSTLSTSTPEGGPRGDLASEAALPVHASVMQESYSMGASHVAGVLLALRDLHQELAEVSTFQQPNEGVWRVLQAGDDVLAVAHLTLTQPPRHIAVERGGLIGEVPHDEPTQGQPLGQDC